MIHNNRWAVIEFIYILTIVIIITVSFLLLYVAAKKNNIFSNNLVTSRILSQEGLKEIISLRNQNKASIMIGSKSFTWSELFDRKVDLPSCANQSNLTISCADFRLTECDALGSHSKYPCIELSTVSYTDQSWRILEDENKMFSRKIRITNAENNGKNITVFIWWIDSEGLHTSPITYKLMQNQE